MRQRCLLVLIVLLSVFHSQFGEDSQLNDSRSKRIRRIVFGEDLGERNSGYQVTNYFVWISNNHICSAFHSFKNFFQSIHGSYSVNYELGYYDCDVDPQDVKCGGALLTPTIVQTACHCVGVQMVTENPDEDVRYYPDDAFTNMALVYNDATRVSNLHRGYVSKLYLLHQKCRLKEDIILYDYGLIVLKTAISPDAKFASTPTNFAPIYSEKVLEAAWSDLQSKEPACLFVGYGRFKDNEVTKPLVLQHTWRVMQNYRKCYSWTVLRRPGFTYETDATWSCFFSLPGNPSRIDHGDSGSPVTCNNMYIGFVSITVDHLEFSANPKVPKAGKVNNNFTKISPTIFSRFSNAAEYRDGFIEDIAKNIKEIENLRRRSHYNFHNPH